MPAWLVVILLLFIGFILLLVELFVIPGFGFVGLSGMVLIFLSSYVSFKSLNLIVGLTVSIGSFVLVIFFIRFFAAKVSKSLSLQEREGKDRGFTSSRNYAELAGKEGKSITDLRPAGMALIEGMKVSVTADAMFIEKGTSIKVIKVEGNKIFVRTVEE